MEEDNEDLFDKKDLRKKKEKKRSHKQTNSKSEKEECAKESFKKMRDELAELRKKEADRAEEFEALKRKIEDQDKNRENRVNRDVKIEYTLEFNREQYLNKGFIESAKWIKDTVAKNMTEKMTLEKNKIRFEALLSAKKSSSYLGVRACARFNRGEPCHSGKWHTTHRPDGLWTRHGPAGPPDGEVSAMDRQGRVDHQARRNELRLHACTLCIEALGAAYGHTVLNCPWILKKNWIE